MAEHAVPIFFAIALAIVVGAGAVFYTWQKQGDTASQVHVIQPQVKRINKAICDRRSLGDDARARACAERIRIGLVNCRRSSRCRAAYIALATYPPPARPTSTVPSSTTAPSSEGGDAQNPSNAGQQPSPGDPGHHGRDSEDHDQGAAPAPSPEPPAAAGGSSSAEPPETPGNGAQGASPSGVGVEVCALERTCVGAEVDVDPKGLIP